MKVFISHPIKNEELAIKLKNILEESDQIDVAYIAQKTKNYNIDISEKITKNTNALLIISLIAAIIIPSGMIPDADAKMDGEIWITLNVTSYDTGDIIHILVSSADGPNENYPIYFEVTDPNDNLVYNAIASWPSDREHILTAGTSSGENTSSWPTADGTYTVDVWWNYTPWNREYHASGTFQYDWVNPSPVPPVLPYNETFFLFFISGLGIAITFGFFIFKKIKPKRN